MSTLPITAPTALANRPTQPVAPALHRRLQAGARDQAPATAPAESANSTESSAAKPNAHAGRSSKLSEADQGKLKKALGDFESVFLQQMLGAMRKNVPDSGNLLGQNSQGEKIFRDLLDTEYAKIMSQRPNNHGLKETMYEQMTDRLNNGDQKAAAEMQRFRARANSLNTPDQMTIDRTAGTRIPGKK